MSNANSTAAKDAALLETIDESATMGLHRSNLMRLQVTELLQECQIPDLAQTKWALDSHQYLVHLTDIVQQLPPFETTDTQTRNGRSDKSVSVVYKALENTQQPQKGDKLVVEPIGCTRTAVAWTKPTGNAKTLPTFSLMVQLPSSIFGAKDYLNYRYMDKRNVFIHQVAQHLAKHSKKLGRIQYQWATASGSPHLLLIPPSTKKQNGKTRPPKFQVHLHFGMQSIDWIPKLRLVPNRCNIKSNKDGSEDVTSNFASQWYTHCLLHDARHLYEDTELSWLRDNHNNADGGAGDSTSASHNKYCHPNVDAALVLIQVWALQRGLWRNHDGWTKEHVALLVLYLLRTHKMNPRMTPIQLFTVVLQTWATTNWLGENIDNHNNNNSCNDDKDETPLMRAAHSEAQQTDLQGYQKRKRSILVLPLEGCSEGQTIQRSQLAQVYRQQTKESPLTKDDPRTLFDAYALTRSYHLGPVFLDPSMTYNYLGGVSPNYMKLLQAQAKKSLLQQIQAKSSFGHLFMEPARFWSQWDLYVQIPVAAAVAMVKTEKNSGKKTAQTRTKQEKRQKTSKEVVTEEEEWESSTRNLVQLLERALGNRIHGMRVLSTGNGNLAEDGNDDGDDQDTDEFPSAMVTKQNVKATRPTRSLSESPTGTNFIVLGISVNPETSQRIVDRGPPAEDTQQVQSFVQLWGNRAQLRRFKDGAIVQAVIWNAEDDTINATKDGANIRFRNEDRLKAGIVERIVRHIVGLHYSKSTSIKFALPNLLSVLDGVAPSSSEEKVKAPIFSDPAAAHRNAMLAFDSLSDFLRKNSLPPYPGSTEKSRLGLPLPIDSVEPLAPCLRYSELFPPIPHPFLGGTAAGNNKVSGVIASDPILIQIRFGPSSKWPNDLKAMGAAKTAMLIQLSNGIESMGKGGNNGFDGPILVTPSYAELGYKGYCFRILVRADPELRMLQGLHNPTREASVLLKHLTRKHILAATHHSTIHAVHTLHPSAGAVVRLAKRWVSGHLLSRLISLELIELLVAKIYDEKDSPLGAPGTVATGFLRFLQLLATHDWLREPLIVNPRGHITDNDHDSIVSQFENTRGPSGAGGPPMYIIAPYNRQDSNDESLDLQKANSSSSAKECVWTPSVESPEWVVLSRATALARRSYDFLTRCLKSFDDSSWAVAFHESAASLQSYSVLLRVDSDFVIDSYSSSTSGDLDVAPNKEDVLQSAYTRSMLARFAGPKILRRKMYRNLRGTERDEVILHWDPIESLMNAMREKFGHLAVFFYNDLSPEVIAVRWRPDTFTPIPFSIMTSEYVQPGEKNNWKSDSLVARNSNDILRDMAQYYEDIVTTIKVFDDQADYSPSPKKRKVEINEENASGEETSSIEH